MTTGNGCARRLDDKQKILAEAALPLAVKMATRYCGRRLNLDAQGAAHLGVMRAAATFQSPPNASADQRKVAWGRWLRSCVRSEVGHCAQEEGRHHRLKQKVIGEAARTVGFNRDIETIDSKDEVARLLSGLHPQARAVIEIQIEDGVCASEAGATVGLSPRRARKVHQNATEFMWSDLKKRYLRGDHV